ncbi:MAG: SDR family oxidoreductase [Pseudomonadota bacterium]
MNPFAADLLKGKKLLVTGGGTGLGRTMTENFLRLGASVAICGRRLEVLDKAAAELREAVPGATVTTHRCDIRDATAVDAMIDAIWQDGPLDILINNAAANFIAQTESLSARAADAILNITMHGALYCTLAAGKRWIEAQRGGVVLSILSTSVITGRAFTTPSAMAKAGVLAMTRSLAVEWGPKNIRLVAIGPGSFPTKGGWDKLVPEARRAAMDAAPNVPLGRHGEHQELANLAAFMVSDAATYMNGELVVLDGGAHLRNSGAEDLLGWSDDQWAQHRDSIGRK